MDLPEPLAQALEPLFRVLPPQAAMAELVVADPGAESLVGIVETRLREAPLRDRPALHAGLWLYVDQLDRSHTVSQGIDDATGSFWHGIMHRREGDFSNSHYWFRKVGTHPAMPRIDGYEPHAMIDAVEARHAAGAPDLVDLQRREWHGLFAWCAAQDGGAS